MPQTITLDDFYALFRESERQRQETERLLRQSFEISRQEFDRSKEEFDRRMAESKAESQEEFYRSKADFDRRMAESKEEFDRSKADFDRRMAESKEEYDRRIAKTERIAAQANEAVNNLSSRWGRFVENLVAPAVLKLFQERGILVERTYQRMRAPRGKQNLDIDIFAVNHDVAIVIEVKSRLTQDHVRKFIQTLEVFKTVFTEYAHHQLYGAMAGIEIDGDVDKYAENQGLFIIQQSGDSVCISTDRSFVPRTW